MENALIVTGDKKSFAVFGDILSASFIKNTVSVSTCEAARGLLSERGFDLVIINSPLSDGLGDELSRYIAAKKTAQVMLLVKNENIGEKAAVCEAGGVLIIAKPVSRAMFLFALQLAKSAHNKIKHVQSENAELKQKIDDMRIIHRAKCVLIATFGMSEKEAHRYIEKQAMDLRVTKRVISERILKTYEN